MIFLRRLRTIQIEINRLRVGRFRIPAFGQRHPYEGRQVNLLAAQRTGIGHRRGVRKSRYWHTERCIFPSNIISPTVIEANARLESRCALPYQPPSETGFVTETIVAVVRAGSQGKAAIGAPVPLRLLFSKTHEQREVPSA